MKTKNQKYKKVMKLIDLVNSLFECTVCGKLKFGILKSKGKFKRGVWQCENGCGKETK